MKFRLGILGGKSTLPSLEIEGAAFLVDLQHQLDGLNHSLVVHGLLSCV
jgi:hypothetical protein